MTPFLSSSNISNIDSANFAIPQDIQLKNIPNQAEMDKVHQVGLPILSNNAIKKENLPILISGAGIAGLTLANALSNMNEELAPSQRVPYIIIERDKSPNARNQGYGLTLLNHNVEYLKRNYLLPKIEERIVTLIGGYESLNSKAKLLSHDLKPEKSKLKKVMARGEVREGLLDRVGNDNVLWDTKVTSFEKTAEGMRVHLISEGKEKTILVANLIAADGVNSTIRNIVAKDTKKYLGIIGIYGRLPNIQALEHLKHEFQVDDFKGWRLFSKPYNVENYNWQLFFPWEENKPLPDNEQMLDFLVTELAARAWHNQYVELVKHTDPETMRCGLLYDRDPISPLKDAGAVTLIGDAAHSISPYKGRGANLAIEGVQCFVEVAKNAIERADKEVNWAEVNRIYEAKHWPGAGELQTSCRSSVWEHHFDYSNVIHKDAYAS